MPQQAKVRAVDVLETFRSNVIVYLSEARPALEEITADVLRLRLWLETEQRTFWESQVRLRTKKLEQAQAALFSSRLGILGGETSAEQMAVQRAKRALAEAETKLRLIKKWAREFDTRLQPLVKQMEKLHTVFSNDMVKAVASLTQTLNTLAAYADLKPGTGAATAPSSPVTAAASPDSQPADQPATPGSLAASGPHKGVAS